MSLFGDFEMSLRHIPGLLGVEGVGDGPEDEDIQLDPFLSLLLLTLLLLLKKEENCFLQVYAILNNSIHFFSVRSK